MTSAAAFVRKGEANYPAAALTSENKTLAFPASVDSIPTSAGQEDHVSMAPIAARKAVTIARDYTLENLEAIAAFGSFDSNHLSIVREDGAMDLYHGKLRAVSGSGERIVDQVAPLEYLDVIAGYDQRQQRRRNHRDSQRSQRGRRAAS